MIDRFDANTHNRLIRRLFYGQCSNGRHTVFRKARRFHRETVLKSNSGRTQKTRYFPMYRRRGYLKLAVQELSVVQEADGALDRRVSRVLVAELHHVIRRAKPFVLIGRSRRRSGGTKDACRTGTRKKNCRKIPRDGDTDDDGRSRIPDATRPGWVTAVRSVAACGVGAHQRRTGTRDCTPDGRRPPTVIGRSIPHDYYCYCSLLLLGSVRAGRGEPTGYADTAGLAMEPRPDGARERSR